MTVEIEPCECLHPNCKKCNQRKWDEEDEALENELYENVEKKEDEALKKG